MNVLIGWINRHSAYGSLAIRRSMRYRLAFFTALLSSLVQPMVVYFVWLAVFRGTPTIAGFNEAQMLTYFFVSQGVNSLFGFHNAPERQIQSLISSGNIALEIVKPVHFTGARLFEVLGNSFLQLIFVVILFSIVIIVYPGFILPPTWLIFCLFLISVILGFYILFFIGVIVGFIAFFTLNISGIYYGRKAVVDLLSGALIPLALLPSWAQTINSYLPFRGIVYTPTMLFLGQYTETEALFHLVVALFWACALGLLSRWVYYRAIRKVTVHGG